MQTYRQNGWTNNVLCERFKERIVYYVPCYLRLKIKHFNDISLYTLSAALNAVLIFTLYYNNLPSHIVKELENGIVLQFNRNEAIELKESTEITTVKQPKKKLITYTIRKFLSTSIESNLFYSPFELLYLNMVITLRSLHINSEISETVRFNLMDHPKRPVKISFTKEDSFGHYKIANSLLSASYVNEVFTEHKPNEEEEDQDLISLPDLTEDHIHNNGSNLASYFISTQNEFAKEEHPQETECSYNPKYFQYAQFTIPMYKFPFTSLSTMFLPLWSMALYNLFIFFQGTDMTMRISNSVTLILTLFAFVPTIREQIPHSPDILCVEIMIYLVGLTFLLSLFQSYGVSNSSADYVFIWYQDPWFMASLIITCLTVVAVIILSLIHRCYWEPSYKATFEQFIEPKFAREEWSNQDCDETFSKCNKIHILC